MSENIRYRLTTNDFLYSVRKKLYDIKMLASVERVYTKILKETIEKEVNVGDEHSGLTEGRS